MAKQTQMAMQTFANDLERQILQVQVRVQVRHPLRKICCWLR